MQDFEPENEGLTAEPEAAEDAGGIDYGEAVDTFAGQAGSIPVDSTAAEVDEPDDPDPVIQEDPVTESGEQNAGDLPEHTKTAEDIAWDQRNRRQQALNIVAQNQQGRGVPVYLLAAQAEQLMLWLDGEYSAVDLMDD